MKIKFAFVLVLSIFLIGTISAWTFNGTVYDVNGNTLNNTLVNLTYWVMDASGINIVGSNSTTSNESGWFSFTTIENSSYMYQPVLTRTNLTTNEIDYVGQSLPQFPYAEFANLSDLDFYLKEAGTINITAINSSGDRISFNYMVKDTKLGYDIASSFSSAVTEKVIYVPRNRNYSVMIYPQNSLPVSFDWNNFSATESYDIDDLSSYNSTTRVLQKQFNTTTSLVQLTGYIQNTSGDDFANWNEFTIVPFLLEPGDMVYLGQGGMPYNMSAWNATPYSDSYGLTNGQYNITVPGPAEGSEMILFASARNGTNYYGGYLNISTSYGDSTTSYNFTMYPLLGNNWGSTNGNFSLNHATNWLPVNVSSAKQQFNFVNASGSILSNANLHIEATVDYSDYGAKEFTFMEDISTGNASIYLPLLNITGFKEMNVYSMSFSPKRVSTMTSAEIHSNPNITMKTFNPGDIGETLANSQISIALYKSNSSCDAPVPGTGCSIGDSANMDEFNPLSAIIEGGKLSFRMGMLSTGIIVHYINVDMLASGPPDAAFDSSATESTSGSFSSAMRFGSSGPTIYDYVLISMPYTEGNANSQSGLNENADVNMSIPNFYDEDWNQIWSSSNGTNASSLAGNYSHYSTYESEWQTLMQSKNCTKTVSELNATNPCYVDTTNNRIWIRLPHFSGTQPNIVGSSITYTEPSTSPTSSSGSSSAVISNPKNIHSWMKLTPGQVTIMKDFDKEIGIKEISVEVTNEVQNAKIIVEKYSEKPAEVSKEKEGKVYQYLEINVENLEDKLSKGQITIRVEKSWLNKEGINKEDIILSKFDSNSNEWNDLDTSYLEEDETYHYYKVEVDSFSYFAISEKVLQKEDTIKDKIENKIPQTVKKNYLFWMILIIIIFSAIIIRYVLKKKKKK